MPEAQSFNVFKQANGQYRWIAFSSTAYQDQDKEIVSTKALSDDCDRADADGQYGPLLWWHTPGMVLGTCDFNAMHGRILVESGVLHNPDVASHIVTKAHELGLSIGFNHPPNNPDADRIYHTIRRFERSLTPLAMASNLFTQFIVKESPDMASLKEKFDQFVGLLGGDRELAERVQQSAEATQKEADQRATYKGVDTITLNGVTYARLTGPAVPAATDTPPEDTTEPQEDVPQPELTTPPADLAAISALVSQEIATALEPALKALSDRLTLKDNESAQQKQAIATLQQQTVAQETALKTTMGKLTELLGEQPGRTKGYRASQDPNTVITDDTTLKAMEPSADPITAFFADVPGIRPGT